VSCVVTNEEKIYVNMHWSQGSFPAGTHGHGVPNLIFVVGTQCPYFYNTSRARQCGYAHSRIGYAAKIRSKISNTFLVVYTVKVCKGFNKQGVLQ